MRDLTEGEINKYRDYEWQDQLIKAGWVFEDPRTEGCFWLSSRRLGIIAASGGGWDHLSVQGAMPNRIPTWKEMDQVKRLFFKHDEWAMQLHAPPGDHINLHENVLHIWRPQGFPIPIPPKEYV